ncbi:MAG: lysophospholipase [Alphaproteobacteria bacterium]|nr:lysophospholipase [Alphaproteobacteria bacterium]
MPNVPLTAFPTDRPLGAAYGALMDISSFVACTLRPPCPPPSENVPPGDGHAVLVFPGFLTGDWATKELIAWLGKIGYDARGWGRGSNWGPSATALKKCEVLLDEASERSGRKVTLIGRSLGGLYARELAKDHPEKVVRVVTLGTPLKFPIATPLSPFADALSGNFDPVFLKRANDLTRNPPVPVTAIYSRKDGIVPWKACLVDESPTAENIEIDSPHTIMGANPQAMRVIAERLAATQAR